MGKIYTKTGDKGKSSLWGGTRISKSSLRMRAYGSVDELNSYLGVVHSLESLVPQLEKVLNRIQSELMTLGSDLATPLSVPAGLKQVRITSELIIRLEKEIDEMTLELPELKSFILPSGSNAGSHLHYARTVCRRAERETVALGEAEEISPLTLQYLNRLSDWLFTAARYQNLHQGAVESPWKQD